jgi:hypothetical protein
MPVLKSLREVDEKSKEIAAVVRKAAGQISESRPWMYAGIATLSVAAGLGVWGLLRHFRQPPA